MVRFDPNLFVTAADSFVTCSLGLLIRFRIPYVEQLNADATTANNHC